MRLWILCEIAVAACDLAEVIGTVIGLNLLFGIAPIIGLIITGFDTFLFLAIQRLGIRKTEAFIVMLVGTIGLCFLVEICLAQPEWRPSDRRIHSLFAIVASVRLQQPAGAVRGDRHPRRDGDAAQSVSPLRPGADAADSTDRARDSARPAATT